MEHRDVLTRNAMAEGEPEGSCMSSLEDRIEAVEQKAREDRIEREKAGKPRGLSYETAVARPRSVSTNGSAPLDRLKPAAFGGASLHDAGLPR